MVNFVLYYSGQKAGCPARMFFTVFIQILNYNFFASYDFAVISSYRKAPLNIFMFFLGTFF